jgi:putative FmdB family regulatory protein
MPTYEYGCTACGHEWEETQRITEAAKEVCPKCAERKAHRLISGGTNFILKGGGWYSDLYASQKPASKKPDANGTSASDSGTKTETKTEPKAESGGDTVGTKTEVKAATSPTPGANAPASS